MSVFVRESIITILALTVAVLALVVSAFLPAAGGVSVEEARANLATVQAHAAAVAFADEVEACVSAVSGDLEAAWDSYDPHEWPEVPSVARDDWYGPCADRGVPVTEPGVYGFLMVYEDGSYVVQGYGDWWTGAPYGTDAWDGAPQWRVGTGDYL